MSLHKGTPVIYNERGIRIFHDDLNKTTKEFESGGRSRRRRGRELFLFFDPQDCAFEKEEARYFKNLDGSEFDPKNVLVHDWEVMVGETLIVSKDYKVAEFGDQTPYDLSKAGHILELKPPDWGKFYDMGPMECHIESDGESVYLNGFRIHLNGVDFKQKGDPDIHIEPIPNSDDLLSATHYSGRSFIHYVPGVTDKNWKDSTLRTLHTALELYRKKVDEEVGSMQLKRFGAVIDATKAMPTPGGK